MVRQKLRNFNRTANFIGDIFEEVSLASRSTIKIGGTAPAEYAPQDVESFETIVRFCKNETIPFFILGGGSNLIFADEGFSGAIISTKKLAGISHTDSDEGVRLTCGAGTTIAALTAYCVERNLTGLEPFAGLPGTIGGAAYMNARCFDCSISDVFISADCFSFEAEARRTISYSADEWAYKRSPFQDGRHAVLSVSLLARRSDSRETIAARCEHFKRERIIRGHYRAPSAGSVFKNNRDFGKSSGELLDAAGVKGHQIGGAQVAPWHANFIINVGGATARDVETLVAYCRTRVREQTGFLLEPEIIFVKNFDQPVM